MVLIELLKLLLILLILSVFLPILHRGTFSRIVFVVYVTFVVGKVPSRTVPALFLLTRVQSRDLHAFFVQISAASVVHYLKLNRARLMRHYSEHKPMYTALCVGVTLQKDHHV